MYTLDWWDVNNFYSACDNCRTWVEFTIKKRPNRKLSIKDYNREVKKTTVEDDEKYRKDRRKFSKLFQKTAMKDKRTKKKT